MQGPAKTDASSKSRLRFPRYPNAADIARIAKQIWKKPRLTVKQKSGRTEFVFALDLDIAEKIRERQLASYMLLIHERKTSLKLALKKSYPKARYGSDRVPHLADRILFKVFVEALTILFEEANNIEGPYQGRLGEGGQKIRDLARRKQRPPDHERAEIARRMSTRYAELTPLVTQLKKFVRVNRTRFDEKALRVEVEKEFPTDWIKHVTRGDALKNLPEIPGHPTSTDSLSKLSWTPRQLSVAILLCEEKNRGSEFSIQPQTILESYLPLGRKLNTRHS